MKLKKLLAGITSAILVGTTMAVTGVCTTASADTIGHAYIIFSNGLAQNWKASDPGGSIDITGNGSYTISYDIAPENAAESILFLGIETDINTYQQNAQEVEIYKNMSFNITSITVDGVAINYNKSAGADGTDDNGSNYRLSIYDTWSSRNVQDIDANVVNSSNITINFDVTGIVEDTPNDTTTEAPTTTTAGNSSSTTSGSTTSAKSDGTTTASSTTSGASSNGDSTTTTVATEDTNLETGDAGIAGVVLVFALTAVGAVATRKHD